VLFRSPQSICLIAPALEVEILKDNAGFDSLSQVIGCFESSQKSRGLEFPVVIVYRIPIENTSEVLNAYARATTRVIAIYDESSIYTLPRNEREIHPFYAELLKNPRFKKIASSKMDELIRALGWQLKHVPEAPFELYWNGILGAWIVPKNAHNKINTRLWESHLLLKAEYPIIIFWNDGHRPIFEVIYQSKARLGKRTSGGEVTLTQCERCGKTSLPDFKEENLQLCAHCKKSVQEVDKKILQSLQKCQDIINAPQQYTNDQKLQIGFNLIGLAAFERLETDKKEMLHHHILPRFPGKN
jgi:hypothetical protein